MTESRLVDIDLSGLRVGLSGAVPDQTEWGERALDLEILSFVSALSDAIFRYGGQLVHGCHPSFTPRILGLAEQYEEHGGPLATFVMSDLWQDEHLARQLRQPRYADLIELFFVDRVVPPDAMGNDASDPRIRNSSLTLMRERLVDEMDVMVTIGGKRWIDTPIRPGILEELEFGLKRSIPIFLLGGFGGMAQQLAQRRDYLERLRNGLDPEAGDELLTTDNVSIASALIINRCHEIRRSRPPMLYR